jgi:hypothetical protein
LNYNDILSEIFEEEISNNDILANSIKSYSPIIKVENGSVSLIENKTYDELIPYINVDININRDNKEYFFDLFSIPNIFRK